MVRASVFAILGLLTAAIPTAADAPKLTFLQPAGGQRGTEVTVTCHGEFPWPVQVDMEGVHVGTLEEKGKLKLQIPQNLNQDRAWIRLYNDEGASERVPFLIGNLADVSEQEPNDALEQAQQLERQTSTVNGLLEKNGDSDAFAVECQAGQVLIAALEANAALGSPMDAILQIVSREGNILAENHDCVGLDPRVVYEVTESGTYYVRLFAFAANPNTSIRYHGGDDYVYRLTITTGPFISHVTPSIVQDPEHDDQHGGTVERSGEIVVTPIGWNIAGGTRLLAFAQGASGASTSGEVENDSDFRLSPTSRLGLVHAPGFAGRLRVRLDRYDTVSGTTCPVPGSHCGCLTEPRQIDSFALAVAKEQPIVILVESPGIDSPLAPEVVLTEPSGKVVSEAGSAGAASDVVIRHTPTEDGVYRLTIRDRYGAGSPQHIYRFTVRPDIPDYRLSVDDERVIVSPGKETELTIKVARHAVGQHRIGEIKIGVMGLPDSVDCQEAVSASDGDTAEKVVLSLAAHGEPFSGPIVIRGLAEEDGEVTERFAFGPPKLGVSTTRLWLTVKQ